METIGSDCRSAPRGSTVISESAFGPGGNLYDYD